MNLSFKKLNKLNNKPNTDKLKGKNSYISLFYQQMLIRVTVLISEQVCRQNSLVNLLMLPKIRTPLQSLSPSFIITKK